MVIDKWQLFLDSAHCQNTLGCKLVKEIFVMIMPWLKRIEKKEIRELGRMIKKMQQDLYIMDTSIMFDNETCYTSWTYYAHFIVK